jgi:hypothetical protein
VHSDYRSSPVRDSTVALTEAHCAAAEACLQGRRRGIPGKAMMDLSQALRICDGHVAVWEYGHFY